MRMFFAFFLLLGACLPAMGASPTTVQKAIKMLPPEQAKNLIRIEAREAAPIPDQWYIQVYDAAAENGVHEFVVSQKGILASRTVSQFLASAKPEDVVGARLVKIDSDDLVKLLQQYCDTNNLPVAKVNYTMLKEATNPAPVWKMVCFDESGKKLAELVVNARNANVVTHEGFEIVPGQTAKPSPSPSATPVPVAVKPSATPAESSAAATPVKTPAPVATVVKASATPAVPVATAVKPASAVPVAVPVATPKPKPSGGLFQRMFRGKPTPTPTP